MHKINIILFVVIAIFLFHPDRHAKYYQHLQIADVLTELVPVSKKLHEHTNLNLTECPFHFYKQLLQSPTETNAIASFIQPKLGGEYAPIDCKAIFKVAIIVPYRNRPSQLQLFVKYMHTFLQEQKIHYRIFIAEQNDSLPFNRAKMLNVGVTEAMKMNFPCLILHDVDLIPLNQRNIYACFKKPRHMSGSIDKFRYNLPYLTIVGGAIAIQLDHFKLINGMSNLFKGWGGEDDDLYMRLKAHNLAPYRLPPEMSSYTMLKHDKQAVNKERWKQLEQSVERHKTDGLNSIPNNYKVKLEPLLTHILV